MLPASQSAVGFRATSIRFLSSLVRLAERFSGSMEHEDPLNSGAVIQNKEAMKLERLYYSKVKPPILMFDFDGVICNSLDVVLPEVKMVFDEVGFDKLQTREELIALLDGNVFLRLTAAGFPIKKLKWLGHKFKPHLEHLYRRIEPFPGIVEVINHAAEAFPLYIITGNRAETVASFCSRNGIEGIREIIGSDIERSKIKSIRRIKKLHPRRDPYYIGDTLGDMHEARKAGVKRIGAVWGWHGRERLRRENPEYMAEKPEDLTDLFLRFRQDAEEGKMVLSRLGKVAASLRLLGRS